MRLLERTLSAGTSDAQPQRSYFQLHGRFGRASLWSHSVAGKFGVGPFLYVATSKVQHMMIYGRIPRTALPIVSRALASSSAGTAAPMSGSPAAGAVASGAASTAAGWGLAASVASACLWCGAWVALGTAVLRWHRCGGASSGSGEDDRRRRRDGPGTACAVCTVGLLMPGPWAVLAAAAAPGA